MRCRDVFCWFYILRLLTTACDKRAACLFSFFDSGKLTVILQTPAERAADEVAALWKTRELRRNTEDV